MKTHYTGANKAPRFADCCTPARTPAQRLLISNCICLVLCLLTASPVPADKLPNPQQAQNSAQSKIPVEQLQIYLDGFHNYKSESPLPAERQHQMRVAHYCQQLNPDLAQCVIYDGNTKSAHLIGIEYVISDPAFQALPPSEKQYWHPHDGEVDSGMLVLPGMPADQETFLLQKIRTTHGKTWHLWNTSKDKPPLGVPKLMWAISPDKENAQTRQQKEQRKKDPSF